MLSSLQIHLIQIADNPCNHRDNHKCVGRGVHFVKNYERNIYRIFLDSVAKNCTKKRNNKNCKNKPNKLRIKIGMVSISNKYKNSIYRTKIIRTLINLIPNISMIQKLAIIEIASSEILLKQHNSARMSNLNNIWIR